MGNVMASSDMIANNEIIGKRKLGPESSNVDDTDTVGMMSLISHMTDEDNLFGNATKSERKYEERNNPEVNETENNGIEIYMNKMNFMCNQYNVCDSAVTFLRSKKDGNDSFFSWNKTIESGPKTILHNLLSSYTEDADALMKRIESNPEELVMYNEEFQTPLLYACKIKDLPIKVLKKMIETNPKALSFPDNNGSFPLHHYASCTKAYCSIILLMIQYFPDALMYQNQFGGTPTSIAISCDRNESLEPDDVILTLLNANPQVSKIPNKHGYYILHYVGRSTKIKASTIKLLISMYPEALYKRNIYGATPIFLAMYWDAPIETMKVLLEAAPSAVNIKDERGLCTISSTWNLFVRKTKNTENQTNRVVGNREIMQRADTPFDLEGEVESWWEKMELILKASYHDSIAKLPEPKIWRVLHATVGVNSPPNLIRFVAKIYRNQVFLKDEEGRLPLHIAARTPTYIPQSFEPKVNQAPILNVLAHINSNGIRELDKDGRNAFQIALEAGKTWGEGISYLLEHSPQIIREKDPLTNLYPFMLSALEHDSPSMKLQKSEHLAKSRVKQKVWKALEVTDRDEHVQEIMKEFDNNKLSTIYLLLRSAPDVLTRVVEGYTDDIEKVWLRQSNDKLSYQISEMKLASFKLKQVIQRKSQKFDSEMRELEERVSMLKDTKLAMSDMGKESSFKITMATI